MWEDSEDPILKCLVATLFLRFSESSPASTKFPSFSRAAQHPQQQAF